MSNEINSMLQNLNAQNKDFAPEMRMKHFDGGKTPRAQSQRESSSKERSAVQAVGYVPAMTISNKEWDSMEKRDMKDRVYDEKGYYSYRKDAPVYKGENYNPRYQR